MMDPIFPNIRRTFEYQARPSFVLFRSEQPSRADAEEVCAEVGTLGGCLLDIEGTTVVAEVPDKIDLLDRVEAQLNKIGYTLEGSR